MARSYPLSPGAWDLKKIESKARRPKKIRWARSYPLLSPLSSLLLLSLPQHNFSLSYLLHRRPTERAHTGRQWVGLAKVSAAQEA
jgi:hypothetical protein